MIDMVGIEKAVVGKTVTVEKGDRIMDILVRALDDSTTETDIKKAGIFDLLDALSGKDNSRFSVDEAQAELKERGM